MSVKKSKKNYYSDEQEKAVVKFLNSKNRFERERIYKEYLLEPINKMIESIIRRYKLDRPSYDFSDLHSDTLSFLITKFDKFDPESGYKSYSYFGTVCKNYLYNEMMKEYKKNLKFINTDILNSNLTNRNDLIYTIDNEDIDLSIFIDNLVLNLKEEVNKKDLTENEYKIGGALIKILSEWKILFPDDPNYKDSKKFNKNLVLLYIRDMTGLNTKEIRINMKRFKSLYKIFKEDFISD